MRRQRHMPASAVLAPVGPAPYGELMCRSASENRPGSIRPALRPQGKLSRPRPREPVLSPSFPAARVSVRCRFRSVGCRSGVALCRFFRDASTSLHTNMNLTSASETPYVRPPSLHPPRQRFFSRCCAIRVQFAQRRRNINLRSLRCRTEPRPLRRSVASSLVRNELQNGQSTRPSNTASCLRALRGEYVSPTAPRTTDSPSSADRILPLETAGEA